MSRIDDIEARMNAATEGPWTAGHRWVFYDHGQPDDLANPHSISPFPTEPVDAQFIAHARTDVPDLVAFVREVDALHGQSLPGTCGECLGDWPCATRQALDRLNGG